MCFGYCQLLESERRREREGKKGKEKSWGGVVLIDQRIEICGGKSCWIREQSKQNMSLSLSLGSWLLFMVFFHPLSPPPTLQ